MALRNIIQLGDPTLRKKSFEVTDFGPKTQELIDDMKETLIKAEGAGLAAPQVGILKRYCIVDVGDGIIELINPVIDKESGSQEGQEGCLSIPGRYEDVVRPMKVKIHAQDRNGKPFKLTAEGFKARAICHEIDHLDGILYIDRIKK